MPINLDLNWIAHACCRVWGVACCRVWGVGYGALRATRGQPTRSLRRWE
jgi:hypothetical protein